MSFTAGQLLQATDGQTAKSLGRRSTATAGAILITDFAVVLTGSSLAMTLPNLDLTGNGFILIIKNDDEHVTNTVTPFSGDLIDGSASPLSLASANSCVILMGDGSGNWRIIARIV